MWENEDQDSLVVCKFPVSDLLKHVLYNQIQLEYVTNKMTCLPFPYVFFGGVGVKD